jgi:uncharacterized protein YyaL (SSP411 family)
MIQFNRNNLDLAGSPYLRQHSGNPIWWQEWGHAVVEEAKSSGKPLLVSVGYAACHWCHVMASGAFSDPETAEFLNRHYISVKVDREERPDIDQFLIAFISKQSGQAGWPLNVFLSPELKPIFGLTYAPAHTGEGAYSFLEIARKVHDFYGAHRQDLFPFELPAPPPADVPGGSILHNIEYLYDPVFGGFGSGQKFPPHATLLYLLYTLSVEKNPVAEEMCRKTLDAMMRGGLNDHLQGGIFRYCVDREWTIPHFEKMLYDQAMALWCYALAWKITAVESYKRMALAIVRCLDDSFLHPGGLYVSSHDADTDHTEGVTYLWEYKSLQEALSTEEFSLLCDTYRISPEGNFEGRTHLTRANDRPLSAIEQKLLELRRTRPQPQVDTKILCGANALAVIALVQASRAFGMKGLSEKAGAMMKTLLETFWDGSTLSHSLCENKLQDQGFLGDAGAVLTALTMLAEDSASWKPAVDALREYVFTFKKGETWYESQTGDFVPVVASVLDHPVPSGVALAEMGLYRAALLRGEALPECGYREPFQSDFYNIAVMQRNGLFHIITSQRPIDWSLAPVNTIRIPGDRAMDCYRGTCGDTVGSSAI